MPPAQIQQPHSHAKQAHRLVAARESGAHQQLVAVQVATRTGLLQGGLAEVVELDLDERLVRPIARIQPRHARIELAQQLGQMLQAAGQVRQILVEGVLHAHRLAPTVHLHRTLIDAPRQVPQAFAKTAELAHQGQLAPVAQVQAGVDAQAPQLVRRDLAHSVQFVHRQCGDEVLDLIGGDHEQAIGFAPVTGDLGQELVRRHPGGHGDVQLLRHPPANVLGDARGAAVEMRAGGHVQVGFVQRQRLDDLGVVAEDRVDFPRHRLVGIHARAHHLQVRAQLQRLAHGHGRTHSPGPRFIVAGGNHPAPVGSPAYRQRFAGQARIVTHLDGGIETVAVDVDDLAHAKPRPACSGSRSLPPASR